VPTYEYRCKACSNETEVVQSFTDDALTTCEACGGELRKLFGNVGIAFKGTGFYKNDSRDKPKSTAKGDGGGGEKAGGDKASGDKASSDKGGGDKTGGDKASADSGSSNGKKADSSGTADSGGSKTAKKTPAASTSSSP